MEAELHDRALFLPYGLYISTIFVFLLLITRPSSGSEPGFGLFRRFDIGYGLRVLHSLPNACFWMQHNYKKQVIQKLEEPETNSTHLYTIHFLTNPSLKTELIRLGFYLNRTQSEYPKILVEPNLYWPKVR